MASRTKFLTAPRPLGSASAPALADAQALLAIELVDAVLARRLAKVGGKRSLSELIRTTAPGVFCRQRWGTGSEVDVRQVRSRTLILGRTHKVCCCGSAWLRAAKPHAEARIARFSEERGILDLTDCASPPTIGDVVRIIQNHVCVVDNMVDRLITVRGGEIVGELPVAARGGGLETPAGIRPRGRRAGPPRGWARLSAAGRRMAEESGSRTHQGPARGPSRI